MIQTINPIVLARFMANLGFDVLEDTNGYIISDTQGWLNKLQSSPDPLQFHILLSPGKSQDILSLLETFRTHINHNAHILGPINTLDAIRMQLETPNLSKIGINIPQKGGGINDIDIVTYLENAYYQMRDIMNKSEYALDKESSDKIEYKITKLKEIDTLIKKLITEKPEILEQLMIVKNERSIELASALQVIRETMKELGIVLDHP